MTTRPASFVTFPGDLGVFHQRADVNLLDADTAHLQQSVGQWGVYVQATSLQLSQTVTPAFGDNTLRFTIAGTTSAVAAGPGVGAPGPAPFPAMPSTDYAVSALVACSEAGARFDIAFNWYDASNALIGATVYGTVVTATVPDTLYEVSQQVTSPSDAATFSVVVRERDAANGQFGYVDRVCVRQGTDSTFVPSLRITKRLKIVADVAPATWSPSGVEEIVARWGAPGAVNAYMLRLQTDGTVALIVNVGGTQVLSSDPVGKADGERGLLEVVRDDVTGDVDFTLDGSPLGSTVSGPAGLIDEGAGGAELVVSGQSDGSGINPFTGAAYRVSVHDDTPAAALWVPDEVLGGAVP